MPVDAALAQRRCDRERAPVRLHADPARRIEARSNVRTEPQELGRREHEAGDQERGERPARDARARRGVQPRGDQDGQHRDRRVVHRMRADIQPEQDRRTEHREGCAVADAHRERLRGPRPQHGNGRDGNEQDRRVAEPARPREERVELPRKAQHVGLALRGVPGGDGALVELQRLEHEPLAVHDERHDERQRAECGTGEERSNTRRSERAAWARPLAVGDDERDEGDRRGEHVQVFRRGGQGKQHAARHRACGPGRNIAVAREIQAQAGQKEEHRHDVVAGEHERVAHERRGHEREDEHERREPVGPQRADQRVEQRARRHRQQPDEHARRQHVPAVDQPEQRGVDPREHRRLQRDEVAIRGERPREHGPRDVLLLVVVDEGHHRRREQDSGQHGERRDDGGPWPQSQRARSGHGVGGRGRGAWWHERGDRTPATMLARRARRLIHVAVGDPPAHGAPTARSRTHRRSARRQ